VSLEKRFKQFNTEVVAKKRYDAKSITYANAFMRLVLTRRLAEFLFSAIIIFGGHQLVLLNGFFSPIWPATGVALSAVFLRGNILLLGIFVGTFSSYVYNLYSWQISLYQALLFISFIFCCRQFSLKWIGPVTPLAKTSVLCKFIVLIILFSSIHISLMTRILVQTYGGNISFFDWSTAVLGEINGILCLTPLCLVFDPFVPQRYFTRQEKKWWLSALGLILGHFIFFALTSEIATLILSVILLILLCAYAIHFGQIPLCATLFGISVVYLTGVLPTPHLFHQNATEQTVQMIFNLFTISIITSLILATAKQEQHYNLHA